MALMEKFRFLMITAGNLKRVIISVKSGHVHVSQVRDLIGVLQREKAVIGLFITLEEPTRPMLKETADAGMYIPTYFPHQQCPRVQILTIAELLQGKQVIYPRSAMTATFKASPRRQKNLEQQKLF